MVPLSFAGETFMALPQGALFWPRRGALLLADLHLEKASFFARFGQFLPPYDSASTLAAVEQLVLATKAREVWCLGDSFHDRDGRKRLGGRSLEILRGLVDQVSWTWISGNHDPDAASSGKERVMAEAVVDGICLRHETDPDDRRPEISGHWHPKVRVKVSGHHLSRRCFVHSPARLVLPASGLSPAA